MSRNSRGSYRQVFSSLKEHIPDFDPIRLLSNYNKALMEALKEAFPRAEINGSLSHFQHVWKLTKVPLSSLAKFNDFRMI